MVVQRTRAEVEDGESLRESSPAATRHPIPARAFAVAWARWHLIGTGIWTAATAILVSIVDDATTGSGDWREDRLAGTAALVAMVGPPAVWLGWAQARALRRVVGPVAAWPWATGVGAVTTAWAIVEAAHYDLPLSDGGLLFLAGLAFSLGMAVAQATRLRGLIDRPWLWPVGAASGYGTFVATAIVSLEPRPSDSLGGWTLAAIAGVTVYTAVTGVLLRMLTPANPASD